MKENYKISKVLIPVDFSERSIRAIEHSIRICKENKAEMILYNSFIRPQDGKNLSAYEVEHHKRLKQEKIAENFNEISKKIEGLKDCNYKFVSEPGISLQSIEKAFKTMDVDLMVLATHGVRGIELMWGSKTTNLISRLKGPILVLPDEVLSFSPKKICLAYDFSKKDQNIYALSTLRQFAEIYNAHIRIIDVRKHNYPKDEARLKEEKKISLFFGDEISHDFETVIHENVEYAIIDYVQSYDIDLIALMPREYNFVEKLFHRSLTELLAGELSVPLLTLVDK